MAKQELMKEGIDPVSGNEKPVGALPEEVRDDVDAKLSVGEFVLPADVVRYIGLNNIMKLRDAAKAGLARMEQQGQMGNGDEQVVEGHNIDMDEMIEGIAGEKEESDDTEMAFSEGGMVPSFAGGGYMRSQQYTPVMQYQAPNIPTVAPAVSGVPQVQPIAPVAPVQAASAQYIRPVVEGTRAMQSSQYTPVFVPAQESPTGMPTTTPAITGAKPDGTPVSPTTPYTPPQEFISNETPTSKVEEVVYVGPNGEELTVKFIDGVPQIPIPVGYVRKDSVKPEVKDPEIEKPEIEAPVVDATKPERSTSSSGDSSDGPVTQRQSKTSTKFALAQVMAKNDPKVKEALDRYKKEYGDLDFKRMDAGQKFKEVMKRIGITGIIGTVVDALQIGWAKSDLFEAIADAETGVSANLLADWSESDRDPIEIMQTAEKAQNLGASNALALAMAIDDRFDADVLGSEKFGEGSLSLWERMVAETQGVNFGSEQAAILAKEEIDFWEGDLDGMIAFHGDDPDKADLIAGIRAERDALQAKLDQYGLGDLGSLSADDVDSKIQQEVARREQVARDAEAARQARLAEIARQEAAEAARKAALAEEQRQAEARAAEAARVAAASRETSGSWSSGDSGTPVYTSSWSASNKSSWDTSGGGTGPGGSYDISSWFGAKGGIVNRKHTKKTKTKRKTSL